MRAASPQNQNSYAICTDSSEYSLPLECASVITDSSTLLIFDRVFYFIFRASDLFFWPGITTWAARATSASNRKQWSASRARSVLTASWSRARFSTLSKCVDLSRLELSALATVNIRIALSVLHIRLLPSIPRSPDPHLCIYRARVQLGQMHDGHFDESHIAPLLGNMRTRLRLVANHLGVLSGGPRNFNRVRSSRPQPPSSIFLKSRILHYYETY